MKLPKVNSERWLSLDDLEGEIWKDVVDYEGLYCVSNLGRVKSLCMRVGRSPIPRTIILRQRLNVQGYYQVSLHQSGSIRTHGVARLVAKAFIANPNNYSDVNHKDETHTNNCVWNLEWCTHKYNMVYGTAVPRRTLKLINNALISNQVAQYDLDGNFIQIFPSVREAKRTLGLKGFKNIYESCEGKRIHTCQGFQWRYVKEGVDFTKNIGEVKRRCSTAKRKVYQYTMDMSFVKEYESSSEAARQLKCAPNGILFCCKGKYKYYCGYKWFFTKQ